MALIVEDGTGIANSNSYVSLADARSYALDRGIVLSADDSVLSGQVILAADYIESFGSEFVGSLVSVTQSMSWPRQNVMYSDGSAFPINAIPIQLRKAQYEAIIVVSEGIELQPNKDNSEGGFATLEKVGPIETKYSEIIGTSLTPFLPKVIDALESLLVPTPVLRTIRV